MAYQLSRHQLLLDLYQAYKDARRHKRNKSYQKRFESRLELNLNELAEELWMRTYKPCPSTCFIIEDPKKREVFAAAFRDRIVHHLYYNYVHEMLERTFIYDAYSCIKGRGTHFGINRLEGFIRKESQNYQERCHVLKMDIQGYFMHINREKLLEITLRRLGRMGCHRVSRYSPTTWSEVVDMGFVEWLSREIILLNPIYDCVYRGSMDDWRELPRSKSLFYSPPGCGLPIGNLTSQLFSNVYLNEFDQYMKRTLRCRSYGRYVDDFFVVSADKEWLLSLQQPVTEFLREELGLVVQQGKTMVCDVNRGVSFLGAYLKPWRRYVSSTSLRRMRRKLPLLRSLRTTPVELRASINSFLGIMSHYRSWRLRCQLFRPLRYLYNFGRFADDMRKYRLYPSLENSVMSKKFYQLNK